MASAAESAEQLGQRLAEAGKDIASVQDVALSEIGGRDPAVRTQVAGMDLHAALLEVEDPDAPHAEPEIFRDLGTHLRRTVARGENLDGKVRRDLREAPYAHAGSHPPLRDEGDVRAEQSVRIALEEEPGRLAEQ